MITKDNLKEVLTDLHPGLIVEAMDSDKDYIGVWVYIANVGAVSTIEALDYSEEKEKEYADNGMLFCSKDDFQRLTEEVGLDYEQDAKEAEEREKINKEFWDNNYKS